MQVQRLCRQARQALATQSIDLEVFVLVRVVLLLESIILLWLEPRCSLRRNVVFYAAWAVFLYVGYYAVGAMKPEEISYDPFEILGISTVRYVIAWF